METSPIFVHFNTEEIDALVRNLYEYKNSGNAIAFKDTLKELMESCYDKGYSDGWGEAQEYYAD